MAMLDTTALVDLSRGPRAMHLHKIQQLVGQLIALGESIFTSRLNEAELRVGIYRAADPANEAAKIDALLDSIVILEFDAAAARLFARLRAELLERGRPVPAMDLLIASVAMSNGQALVTRNARDFDPIGGLILLPY